MPGRKAEEAAAAEARRRNTFQRKKTSRLSRSLNRQFQFSAKRQKYKASGKPDGTPYYLMDMLQYSGLDMDNITAPVVLEVNSVSASFKILKENDIIAIYEENRQALIIYEDQPICKGINSARRILEYEWNIWQLTVSDDPKHLTAYGNNGRLYPIIWRMWIRRYKSVSW